MHDMRSPRIVALAALFTIAGCGPSRPSEQQVYVSQVVVTLESLGEAGQRFGTALNPWSMGGSVDPAAIDASVASMEATLNDVRATLDGLSVPDDETCRRLDAAADEYLLFQADALTEARGWAETAKSENPASEATRRRIYDELTALNAEELKWKAKLDAFADKFW